MISSQIELPLDIMQAGESVRLHYCKMLDDGQTPRFAAMCALQQAPGTSGSDRAVMEDRLNGEWLDKMPKKQARVILQAAKEAGISPSGKYYMSGLADKRGPSDPSAWIDSASDILRVAKERNLHVNGIVNHEAHEVPPPESKALSNRLVKELSAKEKAYHPKASAGELKEIVISKYSPRHKRGK